MSLGPSEQFTVRDVIEDLKTLPHDSPIYFHPPNSDESTWEWHFFGVYTTA